MFALRTHRPQCSVHVFRGLKTPHCRVAVGRPRTFVSSTLQTVSEGFLDLAIALPYPESLPPYSTTIILATVVTRLVFTVPFSVWAKRRQWRAEDLVIPQLKSEQPKVIQQALRDMHQDGFKGNEGEARKELDKRVKPILSKRKKELFSEHGCSPIPTMTIPPLTQLPLFVGFSMMLSRISQPPTVFDAESFLTLTSLSHGDPTQTLPIVLGLITLANVESSRWFISGEALEREKKVEAWTAKRRARGEVVLEPKKIMQTSMRILSVGRILIAIMVPGSIQLYWIASATFGLVQTWILDFWDSRRRRLQTVQQPPDVTPDQPKLPRTVPTITRKAPRPRQ